MKSEISSVRFALGAASPLGAGICPFECASLWVGLRPSCSTKGGIC